jgi:hypothetical protein
VAICEIPLLNKKMPMISNEKLNDVPMLLFDSSARFKVVLYVEYKNKTLGIAKLL